MDSVIYASWLRPEAYSGTCRIRHWLLRLRSILLLAGCLCCLNLRAQNLVPNPGFEEYVLCGKGYSTTGGNGMRGFGTQPGDGTYGTGSPGWQSLTGGVGHLLPCNVEPLWPAPPRPWFQPHSGEGYIYIYVNGEYVPGSNATYDKDHAYAQAKLLAPLQAGCTYRITFYARLLGLVGKLPDLVPPVASDGLSAYVSREAIYHADGTNLIGYPAQAGLARGQLLTDTVNYVPITGTFVAQGGEQYLTLGNFRPTEQTTMRRLLPRPTEPTVSSCRYAIDDVSVVAVPPAELTLSAGPDRQLCPQAGSSLTLTASAGFAAYRWSTGQTTRSITITEPGRYIVAADFGCGTVQDTVVVTRQPADLRLLPAPAAALCPGSASTLTAAAGFTDYRWADGPTGATRSVYQPGWYRLTATTAAGCPVQDSVLVLAGTRPVLPPLPADTLMCAAEPLMLRLPAPPPGTTYTWPDGSQALTYTTTRAGLVPVLVTTACGQATATVLVRTQDCAPLQIPNVVTANADGRNDFFVVQGLIQRPLGLRLYDRWGRQVYARADYQNTWPGPGVAPGLYYYHVLDARYRRTYRGWVEVLR
ncbi:gliding motility-associated C-terminal domain-containing protein [Hymenobacter sp. BT18]|uniref:T9SS type B sorting domain-containing protein n=1 Tax=Hymenobacter sp. BT18 TaxID=2835648 RepID=UPI00143E2EA3|nr:gliding motility-associated C-terminal domain-containing protein [Hymenobacter sp. BT18]QIX62396.1 gliding motility-associated C-terminal domain-containing protein [Hymenobacter sp. BT18]